MSYSLEDAWNGSSPFVTEPRVSVPSIVRPSEDATSARASVHGAAPDERQSHDEDDDRPTTSAKSVSMVAMSGLQETVTMLLAETRTMRQENARQSVCLMALLALQSVMLFIYLDRLRGYHHAQQRFREAL